MPQLPSTITQTLRKEKESSKHWLHRAEPSSAQLQSPPRPIAVHRAIERIEIFSVGILSSGPALSNSCISRCSVPWHHMGSMKNQSAHFFFFLNHLMFSRFPQPRGSQEGETQECDPYIIRHLCLCFVGNVSSSESRRIKGGGVEGGGARRTDSNVTSVGNELIILMTPE